MDDLSRLQIFGMGSFYFSSGEGLKRVVPVGWSHLLMGDAELIMDLIFSWPRHSWGNLSKSRGPVRV